MVIYGFTKKYNVNKLVHTINRGSGYFYGMGMGKKNSRSPYLSTERGAILLMVLIIILTISLLGATLMALFFNVLSLSQIELDRARALYLAEAGIAAAIGTLKNQAGVAIPSADSAAQSEIIVPATKLNEGSFEVYNDYSQSTIVSIGNSNGVKRTIQVRYNAF
jgi:Tfp pilus assembly protein PilX